MNDIYITHDSLSNFFLQHSAPWKGRTRLWTDLKCNKKEGSFTLFFVQTHINPNIAYDEYLYETGTTCLRAKPIWW
jgi:hypothetical protein